MEVNYWDLLGHGVRGKNQNSRFVGCDLSLTSRANTPCCRKRRPLHAAMVRLPPPAAVLPTDRHAASTFREGPGRSRARFELERQGLHQALVPAGNFSSAIATKNSTPTINGDWRPRRIERTGEQERRSAKPVAGISMKDVLRMCVAVRTQVVDFCFEYTTLGETHDKLRR